MNVKKREKKEMQWHRRKILNMLLSCQEGCRELFELWEI